ncbi:MAG: hypothetical protein QM690_22075 [Sphingobium sp.]
MPHYKMISLTAPVEGRDEEFNHWYDTVHMPEILAFPGVRSARRYRSRTQIMGQQGWPYLCVYSIDTDDIDGLLGQFAEAGASGRMSRSDASDRSVGYSVIFEAMGEEVVAAD